LPTGETLVVEIEDDQPLPFDEPIPFRFLLNGEPAQGNYIAIGQENDRRKLNLALTGALAPNRDYEFEVIATDAGGATNSARIYFDTFDPDSVVVEIEDYNFESGLFMDQPIAVPEGETNASTFGLKVGTPGIDYYDTTLAPIPGSNPYRPLDCVGIQRSDHLPREKFIHTLGARRIRRWNFVVSAEGAVRLESALQVSGPYAPETAAVVDPETMVIRAPMDAQAKFYRLSYMEGGPAEPPGIDSISLENMTVVIRYRR
jgi:hypothetical protein